MKNHMRLQALGVLLVLCGSAAAQGSGQVPGQVAGQVPSPMPGQVPGWKTYSYPADGFSVSFPLDPKIQSKDLPMPAGGKAEARMYQLGLGPNGANGGVMVGMYHFAAFAPGKGPDQVLEDGKKGALAQTQAHLLSEKKITLGDAQGLEMVAENPTYHVKARLFVSGTRVYSIMEVYPVGKPFAHAEEFLDSFRIVPVGKE